VNATSERRRGLPLRTRVALAAALLVAAPVVAAALAALLVGGRMVDDAVGSSLERSAFVQEHFQQRRGRQLALISRVVSADPAFVGYVAEAAGHGLGSPAGVDSVSIADLLAERQAELGFDFAIALDPHGRVLARTDRPGESGEDLSTEPLVSRALDDLVTTTGLWRSGGRLFQAAATPLSSRFDLIGFLVTALGVDDDLAVDMARVGGTDVAFVVPGPDGAPGVLASSLDLTRAERLAPALSTRRDLLDAVERPGRERWFEMSLGGERMACTTVPLGDGSGAPLGAVLTMTSLDRQRAAYVGVERAVLGVGLVAMLLAGAVSFVYVRRALQPVRRLAEAAEAAAAGDYDRALALPDTEELRRMAGAFNTLLADLRERREMAAYVSEIARHLPDPLSSEDPALADAPTEVDEAPDRPTLTMGSSAPEVGDATATGGPQPPSIRGPLAAGVVVGERYEVVSVLGAGGMGVVYKVRDHKLGELAALKMLRDDYREHADQLERLRSEIKLARRITHPNVLRTFDYGEHEGLPYISMEYVRGLTLRYLLGQARSVPRAAGLYLMRQLCDGLAAAHDVGIVHRDIKPENMILDQRGTAKLMDFGIALPMHRPASERARGRIAGTPLYLAPEVLAGEEPGVRADLYAVGVVMYEVFVGGWPFRAQSTAELYALKMKGVAAAEVAQLPGPLAAILRSCLDPRPEGRPPSAAALRATVGELHGPAVEEHTHG
jgi:serine/threonine-protein kinase